MRSKLLIGAGVVLTGLAVHAAKDPVVMTVNGVDVPRSEFEYLYHKNSQQQIEAQPLDEYVEMFKIYKLKVADALAAGIDTTAKFKREMMQYRNELAAPYMTDSAYVDQLAREMYDHMKTEVEARHIMLRKSSKREANAAAKSRIDSIHAVLMNGGSFAELAAQFSQDGMSKDNGGNMGYMIAGVLPYSFEKVMFETPEGEISPAFETNVGYHIIQGGKRRPFSGRLSASHILIMCNARMPQEVQDAAKAKADSLAAVVKADPSRFADVARQYSDDKGSAAQGGQLPPFTVGQMIPAFSDAAYALRDGEVSDPVKSDFGWHIIYRHENKGLEPYEAMRSQIISRITSPQDGHRDMIIDHQNTMWGKKFKLKMNKAAVDELTAYVRENGITEEFFKTYEAPEKSAMTIMTIGKRKCDMAGLLKVMRGYDKAPEPDQMKLLNQALTNYTNRELRQAEYDALAEERADYRNLLNEYRDGSLLYEISLQNVWDKASQDTEGLKAYFEAHRDDFKWTEPRVKGLLVKATNDSISKLVHARLPQLGNDTVISTIRKEFGKDVQIDRVLVKKGDNKLVDYLVFSPADSEPPLSANYPIYFIYNPLMLEQPQEVDDVRGLVTGAYQDQLEHDWVEQLKRKYPVTVNEKELKKIK